MWPNFASKVTKWYNKQLCNTAPRSKDECIQATGILERYQSSLQGHRQTIRSPSIWYFYYDYKWVEIAYGLEKIVLMPRSWSVRIFVKKTACIVAWIVTLRIWVETDPGHDLWRKLPKVCQADLDLKDWFCFHRDIWIESEPKITFLDK